MDRDMFMRYFGGGIGHTHIPHINPLADSHGHGDNDMDIDVN